MMYQGEIEEMRKHSKSLLFQTNLSSFNSLPDMSLKLWQHRVDVDVEKSHISCEQDKKSKLSLPPLEPKFLNNLEKTIDELDANLPALNNFILPGGSLAASFLHLCRTHTRKIERKLITFHKNNPEEISSFMLQFINRLSDYFFVFARFTNQVQGEEEATYCPRK